MKIEVSNGEIVDKLTILEIKAERIQDPDKLKNILQERNEIVRDAGVMLGGVDMLLWRSLKSINYRLWDIEDAIRECEKNGDFGPRFVELARQVYITNDKRSEMKKIINTQTGSLLFEEKSYKDYRNEKALQKFVRDEASTRGEETEKA